MNIRIPSHQIETSISRYLKSLPQEVLSGDFPLDKININQLEGIQSGLPIFDNISMQEIKFLLKNFSVLNIAQGCNNACSHCLRNAKPAIVNNSISWEDLTNFTNGLKKLSERLGFNVFSGNKWIALHDDFNPPEMTIKDINGNKYNYFDAVKNVFETLNLPIETVTSGWNAKDLRAKEAVKQLVEYFQRVPEANNLTSVSFNPFHKLIQKSNESAKLGKMQDASFFRHLYVDRIAEAIKEFLPLFKDDKATIIYRHASKNAIPEVGAKETFKLYEDVYSKLKQIVPDTELRNIDKLKPEYFAVEKPEHFIEPKGRGRQFFSSFENLQKQKELIEEKRNWETLSDTEKVDYAYNYTLKEVDIGGNIFTTTSTENFIPTGIKLGYNRTKATPEKFSDIKLTELSKDAIRNNL